jgi:outer membrane protein TolC
VRPVLLVLVLLVAPEASAQLPGFRDQAPTPPATTSRPASASGGAGSPSGGSPFLGGVPTGTATAEPLALSIVEAIERALQYNLGLLNAEQSIDRARGARLRELADLMPNLNARVSETRQEVNLAAFGFPAPAGFPIPTFVGPFNVFDARIYVTQSILDMRARNETRAETHNIAAAQYSYKSARDTVVLVAGDAYLQALAASARADSALAQQQTADALYRQAGDLRQSGLIAGIGVLRAEVQLSTERQRATAARNEFEKAKLRLARIVGLPIGQAFTLSDRLPDVPVPDMTLENALDHAYKTRPDYQAALERVLAAEAARRAIIGEGLPSVRVNADYGAIGLTPGDARGTFAVTGAVNVPIFQGGRTRGRLLEAEADLRARKSEAEDLKASIYYDVRSALLDLQATDEQLQVATRGRELAAQQLVQARDRFSAGVADNIEVVQAQEAVTVSAEQYIAALYGYGSAKGLLAAELGGAEEVLRQYLRGVR